MREKDKLGTGKLLIYGSVLSAAFALVGMLWTDVWLASTQWLLVGGLLGIWSLFLLIEAQFEDKKR